MSRTDFLAYSIYKSAIRRCRVLSKRRASPVTPTTGIWLWTLKQVFEVIIIPFNLQEDTLDSPRYSHTQRDPHSDLHPVLAHQDIGRSLYRLHQCNLLHLKVRAHRILGKDSHRGHIQYHQSIPSLKSTKIGFMLWLLVNKLEKLVTIYIMCDKTRALLIWF